MLPGVATATEIQVALEAGLDAVKFFPAEASGGLAALKALAAPFSGRPVRAHRRHHGRRSGQLPRSSRRSSPSAGPGWCRRTCSLPRTSRRSATCAADSRPGRARRTHRGGRVSLQLRPAAECALRRCRARRGDAAPRSWRGSDPHRPPASSVWEGGGEYNVARGLRRCFGLRTAVVTALADNDIGRLVEDLMLQGGVDTSLVRWAPYDGIGRDVRNGLNFTERGFGVRGRRRRLRPGSHSSQPAARGRRRLGRPLRWPGRALAAHRRHLRRAVGHDARRRHRGDAKAARRHGTVVSYDLNYRPSLWKAIGGKHGRSRSIGASRRTST